MIAKHPTELTIARWRDRAIAWIIDFAIVSLGIGLAYLIKLIAFGHWYPYWHVISSMAFFVYWIILEYRYGQSVGKMVLGLKTTDMRGDPATLGAIALGSFGKTFLLPIDLILGWLLTNNKRQRIFNRLGNTIVIKLDDVKEEEKEGSISYKMD